MLLALEETDNALVNYRRAAGTARQAERRGPRERPRRRTSPGPATAKGVADFLSLLDAERTELQAEDGAAQAEAGVFTSLVGLYRAVGGMR